MCLQYESIERYTNFLALIFYSEEIFCSNFQIRILKHVNFDGENFITCTTSNDEISSFFQNFRFFKKAFFSTWETENSVLEISWFHKYPFVKLTSFENKLLWHFISLIILTIVSLLRTLHHFKINWKMVQLACFLVLFFNPKSDVLKMSLSRWD